jgi:hypothetical protein
MRGCFAILPLTGYLKGQALIVEHLLNSLD